VPRLEKYNYNAILNYFYFVTVRPHISLDPGPVYAVEGSNVTLLTVT
jgi:hypothetical protein